MGQGFIISSHRDDMKAIATAVAHMADSAGYEDFTSWDVRISLSVAAKISGNDMLVTNSDGLILSCSDDPGRCRHIGLHVASGEMEELAASGELNSVTDLGGVYRTPRYVYAMPISEGNPGGGYVFVSSTRSTIMSAWGGFLWVFLAVALAVLSLALVMSLVISKKLSEPLDEMTAAARRFAHGDFSVRVREDKGTDELAALTSSFNAMADSLERSEELRNEFIANVSHELKTPMTTIAGFADGILDGTIPK